MGLHSLIMTLIVMTSALNLSYAQSIDRLENELSVLKKSFNNEVILLDSLKFALAKRVKEIDTAKKLRMLMRTILQN